jgi:hypothetical protein
VSNQCAGSALAVCELMVEVSVLSLSQLFVFLLGGRPQLQNLANNKSKRTFLRIVPGSNLFVGVSRI